MQTQDMHTNPLTYTDPSGFAASSKNFDYTVYFVAGIKTFHGFFRQLEKAIIDLYDQVNKTVCVKVLYPYGDASKGFISQSRNVRHDYRLRENNALASEGGNVVRTQAQSYYAGGEMVFIGHSGGGVASYHGAKMLEELDGFKVKQVVQVGSPKVNISPSFKNKVTYVYNSNDPVTQLGSWRGPVGDKLFVQNLDPSTIINIDTVRSQGKGLTVRATLKILGGHMDYFNPQRVDSNNIDNLSKTINAIWRVIKPQYD